MKRHNTIFLILAMILTACTKQNKPPVDLSKNPVGAPCVFQNLQTAPGWICDEPVSGLDIQAVGMAEKSAAGQNYMQDMARIAALQRLAEKLVVDREFRQCLERTAGREHFKIGSESSDIATVVDKSFADSPIYKSLVGPEGRLYVLVGLDGGTQELVQKSIKASINSEQFVCPANKAQR